MPPSCERHVLAQIPHAILVQVEEKELPPRALQAVGVDLGHIDLRARCAANARGFVPQKHISNGKQRGERKPPPP